MLKKLLLAALILFAIAAGVLFFLWRQAASLPDWYDPEAGENTALEGFVEPSTPTGSGSGAAVESALAPSTETRGDIARELRRELKREAAQGGTMRLDERELNSLLGRALASDPDGQRVRQATRAVHASIEGDRLAVGVVTDFDRLKAAARDDKEKAAIRKLKRLAPWIQGQDFYLGVEGRPRARDGKLTFDGVTVKIGQLSFEPAQLLSLVGQPADRLDRELAVRLPDARLEDIRIEGDALLLSLAEDRSR